MFFVFWSSLPQPLHLSSPHLQPPTSRTRRPRAVACSSCSGALFLNPPPHLCKVHLQVPEPPNMKNTRCVACSSCSAAQLPHFFDPNTKIVPMGARFSCLGPIPSSLAAQHPPLLSNTKTCP